MNYKRSTLLGLVALCVAFAATQAPAAEEVRASHILVRSKADADKLRAEIVAAEDQGKAFSAACRKHSLDVYTKVQAGDLGWFPRVGKMDPVFSEAAFSLADNEISQPVQTPHGWHLIRTKAKRDRTKAGSTPIPNNGGGSTPAPVPHDHDGDGKPDHAADAHVAVPHDHDGDGKPDHGPDAHKPATAVPHDHDGDGKPDHGPEAHSTPTVAPVVAGPAPKSTGTRRSLGDRRIYLTIESARGVDLSANANQFDPTRAVELNLTLKNAGAQTRKVPAASLIPMGLQLTQTHDGKRIVGDFTGVAKPAAFFTELKTYEIRGLEVSLNEYFKELYAVGRFDVVWDSAAFFSNLEARFPEVKDSEGYAETKADLNSALALSVDKIKRDVALNWRRNRSRPYSFSILPRLAAKDRVFAQINVRGESKPIVIELDVSKQFAGSRHFVRLALEGFYDRLNFFDVQADNYTLAGCPSNSGSGAPSMLLPRISNLTKTPHVEGTVSFVSRNSRQQGPVRGGEVGSIFFISLKDHPEWNDVHVPFGRVIEGLDIAKRLTSTSMMESVVILPASEFQADPNAVSSGAGATSSANDAEVTIKTSKGDLVIAMNETNAPNTVSNFVTLAEAGFYDKAADGGKQKFFNVMSDATGKILIQGGSPDNSGGGGESYNIPDEVSESKCLRGSIVMTKLWDPESGSYVQDSASSQFFICLRDIPAYDYEKAFAVFGTVTPASLSVLDQLAQGDEITEVKVTKKGSRDYTKFRKAQ